jgi:hypothetical protein
MGLLSTQRQRGCRNRKETDYKLIAEVVQKAGTFNGCGQSMPVRVNEHNRLLDLLQRTKK